VLSVHCTFYVEQDLLDQALFGLPTTVFDYASCEEDVEPNLDLVAPGSARGGEVNAQCPTSRNPLHDLWV